MVGRNPARYLAPIALVAIVLGTYLIVSNHVGRSPSRGTSAHVLDRARRPHGKYARASFYTVKGGDSLTSISAKTGVTVPALEQLNPSLNPNTLQTGQRIRLRR